MMGDSKRCPSCGSIFYRGYKQGHGSWAGQKRCSSKCYGETKTQMALAGFMEKVTFEPNSGCWLWLGADSKGYGRTMIRRKQMAAHRLSYELHRGVTVPAGLVVLHSCDVPCCVNPSHLSVGTQMENIHDALAKGRHTTQGTGPTAKKHPASREVVA